MIDNQRKVIVGAYLSRKKKGGSYNICQELLSEKWIVKRSRFQALYILSPQSVAILANPILWVVLNINTIVLRINLIRVQSRNSIKQVGLSIHFKISFVRKSDNIKYKTQKSCNENPSLKSTDLRQTQRFIEN